MARVSSAPEDAYKIKGSFADGWGEIIDAKSVVFQYPPDKESGRQDPPGLFVSLTIQRLQSGDGEKSAEEPSEVLLSVQRASTDTGTLDKIRPGNYPAPDLAADPVDCGSDLGSEGNTFFAVQDGFQINDKVKWSIFTQSLQEKGFKPGVLKNTYFPDLVGLRAHFKTETRKKFRADQATDPTAFVVSEIKRFPYEQTAGKAAAKTTVAAGKVGKPAAAPSKTPAATPTPAASGGDTGDDAEEIAQAIITTTLAQNNTGKSFTDIKKLKMAAFMSINKHKPAVPAELKPEVTKLLSDEDFITSIGVAGDVFVANDDGSFTFA